MSDIKLNNMMTQHLPTNNTATACTNLRTHIMLQNMIHEQTEIVKLMVNGQA